MWHIDGAAVEQVALKRILERGGMARVDHRTREVRPTNRAPPRVFDQWLNVDPNAALFEPCSHRAKPMPSRFAHLRQPILELDPSRFALAWPRISEYVDRSLACWLVA